MSPANVTQRRKVETVGRQEAERDVTEEEGHGDWQVVTVIGKYVICVSAGFMFGFAMEKGRGKHSSCRHVSTAVAACCRPVTFHKPQL